MRARRIPKSVLFLFTEVSAKGGIQRFNQTILDACDKLGVQCRVLSLNDSNAPTSARENHDKRSITGFSGNRRRFALAAAGAILRSRYDWVFIGHINFAVLAVAILGLFRFRAPRTMMVGHGIEVWSGIRGLRRAAMRRIDRILCVSRYTRARIMQQAPALDVDRLVIFPNALAESWSRNPPAPLEQAPPERFILSVTRLEPGDRYKGLVTVIEAFSMLADDTLQYFVVGRGADLPFLQLIAARFGVEERVHFMGSLADAELVALYQQCEAFVLPSGKEGFGIVFLEAMFFGAPVIAAREKGALDVVLDGVTGISVRFGDAIAVKNAIESLLSNPALRDLLRSNGRALVTESGPFTFACFARRCADAFEVEAADAA